MSKLHYITPLVPQEPAQTVRLGTNAKQFGTDDAGKLVKLTALESQYVLCAAGDPIEGVIAAVDSAGSGGHSIGSIYKRGAIMALADGLQATPGVGAIAVGDYVLAGSITALGTKLASFPKVVKATDQPGVAAPAAANIKTTLFAWRVVSLGTVGTGAVGTTIVIERV